jgi:hypothetical protein
MSIRRLFSIIVIVQVSAAAGEKLVAEAAAGKERPCGEGKTFASAKELHAWVIDRYQGDDGKWKTRLVLTNRRGEKRVSHLLRMRKTRNNLSRTLLFYISPSDVRGTATLTIEQEGEDDQQRMYIPAMKKHRRISSSRMGDKWSGTDFSYEDLREQEIEDFDYTELKSDSVQGQDCYHYALIPKTPDKSSYSKIEQWVRKDILEPIQSRYYDKKGRFLKELKFLKLRKIQGIWTSHHWLMVNRREKHKTEFFVTTTKYNSNMPDSTFSPRAMTRVPRF